MKKFLALLICLCFFSLNILAANIDFTISSIEKTEKGFLVKGEVTGSDLNSGGIPEQDYVSIVAEVPTSSNFKYPEFYEWYSLRDSKYGKGKKLLTEEEVKGINIKSILLFTSYLRPPTVWLKYGGLGNWEKKAPPKVTVDFSGIIPLEYAGKTVRIHAILKHVIGGPYAAWPGLLYNNKAVEITLPAVKIPTQATPSSNNQTSGGIASAGVGASIPQTETKNKTPQENTQTPTSPPTIIPPPIQQPPAKPKKKEDPCKRFKEKMEELGAKESDLENLKYDIKWDKKKIKWEKDFIKQLKNQRDDVMLSHAGFSSNTYKQIADDIARTKRLANCGNPNMVLIELSDTAKINWLDSRIHEREKHLNELIDEYNFKKKKLKAILDYRKCREAHK